MLPQYLDNYWLLDPYILIAFRSFRIADNFLADKKKKKEEKKKDRPTKKQHSKIFVIK